MPSMGLAFIPLQIILKQIMFATVDPICYYHLLYTLWVLIFADFAVFDKVRENLYPQKMLFWKILPFLGNFGDFSAFRWRIKFLNKNTVQNLSFTNTMSIAPMA